MVGEQFQCPRCKGELHSRDVGHRETSWYSIDDFIKPELSILMGCSSCTYIASLHQVRRDSGVICLQCFGLMLAVSEDGKESYVCLNRNCQRSEDRRKTGTDHPHPCRKCDKEMWTEGDYFVVLPADLREKPKSPNVRESEGLGHIFCPHKCGERYTVISVGVVYDREVNLVQIEWADRMYVLNATDAKGVQSPAIIKNVESAWFSEPSVGEAYIKDYWKGDSALSLEPANGYDDQIALLEALSIIGVTKVHMNPVVRGYCGTFHPTVLIQHVRKLKSR